MTTIGGYQLTLHVDPHPAARQADGEVLIVGSLKISGSLRCPRDLQDGDELIVTVTGADGEVLSRHHAEVLTPTFARIEEKGVVLGLERIHKAKIGDPT
jgi:hypothetical protein